MRAMRVQFRETGISWGQTDPVPEVHGKSEKDDVAFFD